MLVATLAFAGCTDSAKRTDTRVSWPRVVSLVSSCKARRVDQAHDRLVMVYPRGGGRRFWTYEPRIDAIIAVVNRANRRCGPIVFATE